MLRNASALFLALCICSFLYAQKPTREDHGKVIILNLYGTWQEMGLQYGTLLKKEIQKTYQFAKPKATQASDAFLLPRENYCGIHFLDQLFKGVAQGAGITPEQLRTINGVELAYVDILDSKQEGKCACLMMFGNKTKNGKIYCGRNYDWMASFEQLGLVVSCFHPNDGAHPVAILNYPGCLYLTTAMNSQGLFLELNTAAYSTTDYRNEGIHNVWMLWLPLTQAHNTQQAIDMLQSLQAKSCYIINCADAKQAATYEWDTKQSILYTPTPSQGYQLRTNHYVRPGWKHLPTAYEGGCESSICRFKQLHNLASKVPNHTGDLETMKRLFSVKTQDGGALSTDTLFQVLAIPEEKRMLIRTRSSKQWVPFSF